MNIKDVPNYVKQPSIITHNKRLIFVYPFLIDESLNKYSNLVRDFFTVVFTGEIKISNILQVISTTFENPGLPRNENVTPAEKLYQKISGEYFNPLITQQKESETPKSTIDRYQLDQFIQNSLKLLKKYIESNPRYRKFRPCISTITIPGEQFVSIPLIIGTHPYFTHPGTLYWILLLAIGYGIPLNSADKFSSIVNKLKAFNTDEYYYLSLTEPGQEELERRSTISPTPSVRTSRFMKKYAPLHQRPERVSIEKMMSEVFDDVNKTTTFFKIVLNPSKWDQYNGVITNDNVFETSVQRIKPTYVSNLTQAQSLFGSFISSELVTILESYANIMEPAISSSAGLISQFLDRLSSSDFIDFVDIGQIVIDNLQENIRQSDSSKAAEQALKTLELMCKNLSKVKVDRILMKLTDKHVSASYRSYDEVVNFHNSVESIANSLLNEANSILLNLSNIITDGTSKTNLIKYFKNLYDKIRIELEHLFFHEDPRFGQLLEPLSVNNHLRWAAVNGHQTATQDDYNTLNQIADEAVISLTNIIFFLFIYTFVSFICKSIETLKLDVETVKNDATEFPNYCMVIRTEILKALYMITQVKNFKRILKDPEALASIKQEYDQWSPSETQIRRMIDYLRNRLLIPNVISIDESKGILHYRFMFMEKTEKIRLSTVQAYIKSQHDLLIIQ